jgi:hypothetical protein
MATRATKNGSWKVRRGSRFSRDHSQLRWEALMTESAAEGTPISEMLKRVFLKFGVPKQIVTDKKPNFASKSVSDVLASLGVKHRTEV